MHVIRNLHTQVLCVVSLLVALLFASHIYIVKGDTLTELMVILTCVLQKTWGLSQDLFVFCN